MDTDKLKAEIVKLRTIAHALIEQCAVVEATADAQPTAGQHAKEIIKAFTESWRAKYRQPYAVTNWAAATSMIKKLLREASPEDVTRRIRAYVQHDDPFYVRERHPLMLFSTAFNKLGSRQREDRDTDYDDAILSSAPADCRHRPPCRDDVQHTQKLLREQRQPSPTT